MVTEKKEIDFVNVAGRSIPAIQAVCRQCQVLDLDTVFDTSKRPWVATCSFQHSWVIPEPS